MKWKKTEINWKRKNQKGEIKIKKNSVDLKDAKEKGCGRQYGRQ